MIEFLRSNTNRARLLGAAFVLALGAALRFWGLKWGAPGRLDFHPDEMDYVMHHALGLLDRMEAVWRDPSQFDRHTLDPVFLNYPGLLMYLIAGIGLIAKGLHLAHETWQFYLVGRGITALFGLATIPAAAWLALELGAPAAGAWITALWVALMPLHVWEGHAAITDIPMTFFMTLVLTASLLILRRGAWKDYLLAGGALGLAVASKYTAALVAPSIVLGALLARRPWRDTVPKLLACAALSAAFCFAATPYSFLRFRDVVAAMAYEHQHTMSHHYGMSVYANGWWYHRWVYQVLAAWPFSLGIALYVACAMGAVWAVLRLDPRKLIVLAFAAFFFGVTGSWTFTPLRYYLPVLVPAVVLAGAGLGSWLNVPRAGCRRAAAVVVVVVTAYTGVFTLETTARYANDTRVQAADWLRTHLPAGARVHLIGWHRYHGYPLPQNASVTRKLDESMFHSLRKLGTSDIISISSMVYGRHYRQANAAFVEEYEKIRNPDGDFEPVAKFESAFIHKKWYMKLDPMFEGYFVSPTIELYRMRPPPAGASRRWDREPARVG